MTCRSARILLLATVCVVFAVPARSAEESTSSTSEEKRPRAAEETSPAPAVPLKKKLAKRVTISTEGEPLRTFVGRISEENDINVVLDEQVFEAAGSDLRVREINLRNIPLRAALKVVLRTVGLDYSFGRLYGFLDYHYNQAGASDASAYDDLFSTPAYVDGAVFLFGRHYITPGASYSRSRTQADSDEQVSSRNW